MARAFLVCFLSVAAAYATGSPLMVLAANAVGIGASAFIVRGERVPMRLAARGMDWRLCRRVVAFGVPVGCSVCLAWIIDGTSRVMLSLDGQSDAVGLYTAAYVFALNSVNFLAAGIGTAVYPLVFATAETPSPGALERRLLQNFELLIAILFPAVAGMTLLSGNIARLLVGAAFVDGVSRLMPWMAMMGLLASVRAHYFDLSFHIRGKTYLLSSILALGAIVNILLNWLLIPTYGYMASAWAGTITYGLMLVQCLLMSRHKHRMPVSLATALKVACATLFMTLCLLPLLRFRGATALVAQVPAGMLAYALAAIALDILDARRLLATMIRRARGMRGTNCRPF